MPLDRSAIVDWIALQVLPHEGRLRAWLRRNFRNSPDIDDVIQEAYCQIALLPSVAHIQNPQAYFFSVARSLMLQRIRRGQIVVIEAVTDFELASIRDDGPSPEDVACASDELGAVLRLIAALPKAYRQVIELRRLQGLSQKETARRLGVTERVVENNSARGLRMILRALTEQHLSLADESMDRERPRIRARH